MTDKELCVNIFHYASSRFHCVWRSVMAAELHEFVHAVDMEIFIKETLCELLKREIEMEAAYVASRTLFNVVMKNKSTAELQLEIYIYMLKESYQKEELKRIGWIPGKENVADVLTN